MKLRARIADRTACFLLILFVAGCGVAPGPVRTADDAGAATGPKVSARILQKTCPVMGGAIDPEVFTDYKGRRIYFCCPGCDATFRKDPAAYLEKVDAEIARLHPHHAAPAPASRNRPAGDLADCPGCGSSPPRNQPTGDLADCPGCSAGGETSP